MDGPQHHANYADVPVHYGRCRNINLSLCTNRVTKYYLYNRSVFCYWCSGSCYGTRAFIGGASARLGINSRQLLPWVRLFQPRKVYRARYGRNCYSGI